MSAIPPSARQGAIQKLLSKMNLRFPGLFVLLFVVTAIDFVVPDFIPFADEILLALMTMLFGLWKDRRKGAAARPGAPPPVEVLPPPRPPLPPPGGPGQ